MFKAIEYDAKLGCYHIIHNNFNIYVTIPYQRLNYGSVPYKLFNGKIVKDCAWHFTRTLALLLEYKKRNIPIVSNIFRYYTQLLNEPSLNVSLEGLILAHYNWFESHVPEIQYHKYSTCFLNKARQTRINR